ncbi:MAG: tyrosine-type recombinase/integrase [Chloroflexota bacterium]
MANRPTTFGKARDQYLSRATLRSEHTVAAYQQSIDSFLMFLDDKRPDGAIPLLQRTDTAKETPLAAMSASDAPVLLAYAEWLLKDFGSGPGLKAYSPSTVRLRIAGVGRWLQWLEDFDWLPVEFPLAKAQRMVRDELKAHKPSRTGAPEPPQGIEELLQFHANLLPPRHLADKASNDPRYKRWNLTRLRNHALIWILAETGGRVSEVLSLNYDDFAPRDLEPPFPDVVRVAVVGKGKHTYHLRLRQSLPALAKYLIERGLELKSAKGKVPIFVSHDARADGKRLLRVSAWRVVTNTARALGLRKIHPHDLRHWRATQLVNAGQPLDVVQDYLGHQSVETTRAYYAHTDPKRVDQAMRDTPLGEGGSS